MAAIDSKKACKSLQKKGFTKRNGPDRYFELWIDGVLVLHTYVSHNDQDINEYLIHKMSFQCKLDKREFLNLINCPLSKESYLDILKGKGMY